MSAQQPQNTEQEIEKWIVTFGDDIFRICMMYMKQQHLAEDAFQEIFLKAFKSMDYYKGECEPKTWVTRIAINTCKDMLRSAWLRKVILPGEVIEEVYFTMEEEIINRLQGNKLYEEIQKLPAKYKDIFLLYYYQDYSTKEIGQALDIHEDKVKNRLYRGRQRLKKYLVQGVAYEY